MGRKVKGKAFEEEGEAKRQPSNTDVSKFQGRILELRAKRRRDNAKIGSDIRDAKDDAANAGVDTKVMMRNIKLIEMGFTDEEKAESNYYFDKTGQGSFFAVEGSEEEAA